MRKQQKVEFYDLHCHFLPGMDDGCKTVNETMRLLREQYRQGCRGIVGTPHYYADESIQNFLERRKRSVHILVEALRAKSADLKRQEVSKATGRPRHRRLPMPDMAFGAEVAYRDTLVNDKDIQRLCIGKSRYLLLEMPFVPWTGHTIRGVERLINTWNIVPIIAHIERYIDLVDMEYISELMDLDVLVQLNAGNFASRKTAKQAFHMIRDGEIQVICTDSHNMGTRPPDMELAIRSLQKHRMADELNDILQTNAMVFQEAKTG